MIQSFLENQLEQTNHDHLGKIITYASGLDASVVVWIVANARDEHASAIEWLNNHTDDNVSFFLIEIHAYKIGDSAPAPMFKIIKQPNDFVKNVKALAEKGELSADDLYSLVELKRMSNALMSRIGWNYRTIIGFNGGLIGLGVLGALPPATSALLHNASTLAIGLRSMTELK